MSLPINSLYSLTWGDYGTSLVSAVQLLRCHGDLVDVTLAAGGRSFPAHKIVLCAASPFLLDLLKNTPCKHPVVMLAGVNANDLEALLEFVYRGEVSVDHSQLPSLLQAAHCLNIQGLAPQTVSHKDDNTTYTTSIQLHPTLVPQNHVKAVIDVGNNVCTEDLITTLAPTQTVQAQVIETITPDQMSDEVTKDVISQFLPTRKRKQRTKKNAGQGTVGAAAGNAGGAQNAKVMKTDEDGTIQTIIVNSAEEGVTAAAAAAAVVKDIKKETNPDGTPVDTKEGIIKIKSKSQSEQPATCPICQAVIRQSRNLRRHLELRHFKKPGVKKERVRKNKKGQGANANQANGANGTNAGNNGTVTVVTTGGDPTGQQAQQQQQQQQAQQQAQQGQTTIDTNGTISVTVSQAQAQQLEQAAASGQQHVVTQHEHADGTTSLSIAQVQTLDGHQLAIGNLNQATLIRTGESIEAGIIGTHEPTLRPHTELFRVGNTVYTIEERRTDTSNRLT
ncbi:transcription factor GAGA [Anopheles bellator]|uniref:transcription factor GAGA n=1 Tax=Anopheles bellator TaxID=139047 RepID=UPI002647518B|nr:transcription factor GAGA [Anopheles bellator]